MLKVTKTRQLVTEFFAQDGDQQKLVKTTVINTDNKAVSTISETLHDPENCTLTIVSVCVSMSKSYEKCAIRLKMPFWQSWKQMLSIRNRRCV